MIVLEPMTESAFTAFLEPAVADYARDHVADGQWAPEGALEKSRQAFAELLPDGVRTPHHHLFTLVNEAGEHVGVLWFAMRERQGRRSAYVYDVRIHEAFRRQGYGSQAFAEMERRVRALGGGSIALHVAGRNQDGCQAGLRAGECAHGQAARSMTPAPETEAPPRVSVAAQIRGGLGAPA